MEEPHESTITFTVNGRERRVTVAEDAALLDILRRDLGVTSARFGCGAGACGACNVLVDGHVATACDTPMWSVAGKSVTTVEGLGTPEAPHALQTAFIAEQGMQCGYCVSGVLIAAAALLQRKASPTEGEVRAALDRNLCRCGAHNRMVRAVLAAAKGRAE